MHKAGHASSSRHLMPSLINISWCTYNKHQEGAMWRVDDCFIYDCFFCHQMCRSFQNVSLSSIIAFGLVMDFDLPCLWQTSFSGQMISNCQWSLGLDKWSYDYFSYVYRSWRELDSWSFGSGLFWVLFNTYLTLEVIMPMPALSILDIFK